jgi:hypothetical protein
MIRPHKIAAQANRGLTQQDVERSIREGIRFLKSRQAADGSWNNTGFDQHQTGMTGLVTLALLTAGEDPKSATVQKALEYLRGYTADQLNSTYAVSLQTMALAAADPEADRLRLMANVRWLEDAQIKPSDRVSWPGTWSYTARRAMVQIRNMPFWV